MSYSVTPVKAGAPDDRAPLPPHETPAFAGVTEYSPCAC